MDSAQVHSFNCTSTETRDDSIGKFPLLTDGYSPTCSKFELETKRHNICVEEGLTPGNLSESIVISAWALTLSIYIGSSNVSFHVLLNDETRWRTSMFHIDACENQTQQQFVQKSQNLLQKLKSKSISNENIGDIELLEQPVNTAIVIGHVSSRSDLSALKFVKKFITLDAMGPAVGTCFHLNYQNSLLSDKQAMNVGSTFAKILSGFRQVSDRPLDSLEYMSQLHISQLWKFNSGSPKEPWMECFHTVVERHARGNPRSQAIDAWDGIFTYAELNNLSIILAKYLQSHGVGPGSVVPISFERSAWAIVAMLSVSKAGGAFVSIPPYLPSGRREAMVQMISPSILLTTSNFCHLWTTGPKCIPIEGGRINCLPTSEMPLITRSKPEDTFYIIFTSGSTGAPKGCMVSHSSFLNGALRNAPQWKFGPDRRVLQMLSHTFDMSLLEICTSLGSGACVCVPRTEEIEDNLADAINKYKVSLAVMTPSLARRLEPKAVPGLQVLCLGGESFPKELVTLWSERINLFQFYGPSECSINSSTNAITHKNTDPLNIGVPNNAACWVVSPEDYNKLVPIGAIGELLVSGAIVGQGYYKNPVKTAESFVQNVGFLQGDPHYSGWRCYRTGDLVRWNSDGTLVFCGRLDSQVKLNGQRLELGEVEYHLTLEEEVGHAMAIVPGAGRCKDNLMGIISLKSSPPIDSKDKISVLPGALVDQNTQFIRKRLQNSLPRYMVPTIWAYILRMPMSASGKIDRVRVRRWVEEMSESTFREITGGIQQPEDRKPLNKMEQLIQGIWSAVLDLSTQDVGLHQSFIQLGGSSILAQEVVAKCRKEGIGLTMTDILTCNGIAGAASLATALGNNESQKRLLDSTSTQAWRKLQEKYDLSRLGVSHIEEVEDVYPCTPMQIGMFLGQIRKPGSYHLRFFYKPIVKGGKLPELGRIKSAWHKVVSHHPSLRTVFVDDLGVGAEYHSVVLRNTSVDVCIDEVPVNLSPSGAMDTFTKSIKPFAKRSTFHRISLCVCGDKVTYLMIEISHALADGAAMENLMRDFATAFDDGQLLYQPQSHRDFVEYVASQNNEASAKYWTSYLKDCPPCMIPISKQMMFDDLPTRFLRKDFVYERSSDFLAKCKEKQITVASAVRVAWALVLRAYIGSSDVCFTYVAAGRDVPVKDVHKMVGLCLSIQPCRAQLYSGSTFVALAERMQQDYIESMPYQHYPLTELKARLYPKGSEAMFNTAVSMEWTARTNPFYNTSIAFEEIREQDDPTEYDIVANVEIVDNIMKLGFLYWPSFSGIDVIHIANAFKKALDCLLDSADKSAETISLDGEHEFHAMKTSDQESLDHTETCVFDAIEKQAMAQLNTQAVVSWDGEYSYGQLTEYYTTYAKYLVEQGINSGDIVVVCLDKSCWSVITILAILKAGAVFVATNPLHSQQRLENIVNHCHAKLIIVEPRYSSLFETVDTSTIVVNKETVERALLSTTLPAIHDSDIATIVYTSGTTGLPKGIIIDHGSLSTSILQGHGKRYGFDNQTRALQFAAFTFDACLQEIITVLSHGGCVCVPSEDERLSDLAGCITQMHVNLALFTPTVARLIRPQDVPCLKRIILCGEPMSRQDLEVWAGKVTLYNGYGPAEATICVSISGPLHVSDDPSNIGYAVEGTRLWITEAADYNRLAPAGCIGELVIESRQVSRGYLHDVEKTTAMFINPAWLPGCRVYKTGDLAKRNPDGSLTYCGRKDTQVKLRGQRVELGEVEYHVRECWTNASGVVAEVICPTGEEKATLAVFVCTGDAQKNALSDLDGLEEPKNEVSPVWVSKEFIEKLEDRLPCYMVPSIFFTVPSIPLTLSGKTDRQQLRGIGSNFTSEQLARVSDHQKNSKRTPSGARERKLQQLWSSVLNVDKSQISLDDSFFRLGGDSVSAMRLVTNARKSGINLTVADVFRHPHIDEQARIASSSSKNILKTLIAKPFAHIQRKDLERVVSLVGLGPYAEIASDIEDILPATDVQSFYVSRAAESSRDALNYFYLRFDNTPDIARLRHSCQGIVDQFPILRTIFISTQGRTYQVVIRRLQVPFEIHNGVKNLSKASDIFCLQDLENKIVSGSLLLSFTLIRHLISGSQLIIRMSHAQYDGMSWPLILRCFQESYAGVPRSPTQSFSSFISYTIGKVNESRKYWTNLLQGSHMAQISDKFRTETTLQRLEKTHVEKTVELPIPPKGITVASLVSSAWSLVLRQITGKRDVVYGFVVAGRNIGMPQIQEVVGPCMNTVPVRICFNSMRTTIDLQCHAMNQYLAMGDADSLGFQDIVENCTQWPSSTKLDTLLQYHDIDETPVVTLSAGPGSEPCSAQLDWFRKPYAAPTNIEVSARPNGNALGITLSSDGSLLSIDSAMAILTMFERSIRILSNGRALPLDSINLLAVTGRRNQSKIPDLCPPAYLTFQLLSLMFGS
ncbi:nonribosomal peptide synthetase [Trichophyton equinum CBS 127.97]|uniref:Nonribosomal peptide synthetase n=1 Tax=Trichophyton equinum (strain ATCC MYA-4606 / CBS 127.97) TaxID=559882 RepID=F2PM61_TRIEC|nr:nonribosomal peptide synthetase [Trichophyton equinum CBS 127.97]